GRARGWPRGAMAHERVRVPLRRRSHSARARGRDHACFVGRQRAPSLAVTPDGTLLLAWAVGRNDDGDIHWTSSTDQGRTFGAPRVALSTDGYSDAPKLAVAQDGRVHLAFAE